MGKQKYPQREKVSADGSTTGGESKKRGSYSHAKANARRNKRRQEAEARQREYDSLPISKRIKLAKSRPGDSKKEIARLKKQQAEADNPNTNPR